MYLTMKISLSVDVHTASLAGYVHPSSTILKLTFLQKYVILFFSTSLT